VSSKLQRARCAAENRFRPVFQQNLNLHSTWSGPGLSQEDYVVWNASNDDGTRNLQETD